MQKAVQVNERGLRIGEDHPNAIYTDGEVELVLALRSDGWGYKRISNAMEMPHRTVRDICNGRRRCQVAMGWKRVRVPQGECDGIHDMDKPRLPPPAANVRRQPRAAIGALPVAGRGSFRAEDITGTESPELRQFSGALGLLFMGYSNGIDA